MMEIEWDSTNLFIAKNKYVIKKIVLLVSATIFQRILNNGV